MIALKVGGGQLSFPLAEAGVGLTHVDMSAGHTAGGQMEWGGMIRLGRDHGCRQDGALPRRFDPKGRGQGRHDEDGFGQGKMGADAHARACTERQIGEAVGRRSIGQEAGGVEGVGIAPQLAVPVQHPGGDHGKTAGAQAHSADGILIDGLPHDDKGWWIKAQGLLHDGSGEDKVGERLGGAIARQWPPAR